MAENDDFDWGEDPFEGDLDFDMDFDKPNKKGFARSFVTGFLSGVVDKTVGDTDARINTLKMALPKTFSGAFTNLRDLNERRREMFKDIKAESFTAVQDLQYLAKRAGDRLSKDAPNKISGILNRFSEHDFSDWEKREYSHSDANPQMEDSSEEEVNALIESGQANSAMVSGTVTRVGKETLTMMSQIGGRTIGQQAATNQALIKNNNLLQQMLDHQRRVQARTDALKVNLMARQYLASAKYYKFMEAGIHRQINELKEIRRYSMMSDYEKTSTSQAVRKSVRESVFNTVKGKFGGFASLLEDKIGKSARDDSISAVSEMLSGIRMMLTMTEGMPMNYGEMAGGAAAGALINNLPRLMKTGVATKQIAALKKRFPDMARKLDRAYAKLSSAGNVATYTSGNIEELVNSLSKHYTGMSGFNTHDTYEEYKASLSSGEKAMGKTQWEVLNRLKKYGNGAADSVLSNIWNPSGTTFQLQRRTLADSHEQAMWNRRSERALTEEIPRWLGEIWASIEKGRTGRDDIKPLAYDYTKAKFISHNQKLAHVTNSVFDKNQFRYQAESALRFADNVDTDKVLTPELRQKLAYHLTRQSDKKLGFNPYNFLNLENEEDLSNAEAETIRKLMMREFGISDEHLDKFKNGSDVDRLGLMSRMPTRKGQSRLVGLSDNAKSLARFTPDITNALDTLKANGYYDALVESGIITRTAYGDEVDEQKFWNVYKQFLKNPDQPAMKGVSDWTPHPNRQSQDILTRFKTPKITINPQSDATSRGIEELSKSMTTGLGGLKESLEKFGGAQSDFAPVTQGVDKLNEQMTKLVELATTRNVTLDNILARQGKMGSSDASPADEAQAAQAKKSLIDRLKASNLRELFNKGVDKLLDQQPLLLGGLLGSLGAIAFHDPKAAMLIGGGAAAALAYGKIRSLASARSALDSEDLYEEGSDTPILEARKLKNGDYLDMATKKAISTWNAITGSLYDVGSNVVIGARKLAGKLFTRENKEVFLKGLNHVRDLLVRTWETIDPLGRLNRAKDAVVGRFKTMDVFKEGEDSPTLTRAGFRAGNYYKRDESGQMVQLKGWDDIDGPVYNERGETLITQEEYDRGLRNSMGANINKMGQVAKHLGRFGLSAFGKVKERFFPHLAAAKDKVAGIVSANYSPIINSVNRIHDLLIRHWGYSDSLLAGHDSGPEMSPEEKQQVGDQRAADEQEAGVHRYSTLGLLKKKMGIGATGDPEGSRLNSLEDKAVKKKEKRKEDAEDATIRIADALGAGLGGEKKESKRTGLFGLLTSGLGALTSGIFGIAKFFTKSLWGSFKTLTKFATMGLRVIPTIASGIGVMASALITLVRTRSLTNAAGDLMDGIRGTRDGGRRRKARAAARKTPKGRIGAGGWKLGAGLAIGGAASMLADSGLIDEGGSIEKLMDVAGDVATGVGVYQTVTGVAAAAGVDIGLGTLAAGAGTALSTIGSAALPLLFNPITLGVLAAGAVGYGIYKFVTRGSGKQYELRMVQYGIGDADSDLAKKVLQAEEMLTPYVVIGNAKASLSKGAPIDKVMQLFVTNPRSQREVGDVFSWVNGRFKPVFLTYMAVLDAAKIKSLKDYDDTTSQDVYAIAKQVHQTLGSVQPYPYSVVANIDPDQKLLGEKATIIRANNLLQELKQYIDRKTDSKDKATVVMPGGEGALQNEKGKLEAELADPKKAFGNDRFALGKQIDAMDRLKEVNRQLDALNGKFAIPKAVKEIYINDLLPDNRSVDMLTGIRLACYGNSEDWTWRIEAVLKLERYCENLFTMNGGEATFKGQAGDLFGMFQEAFRLTKDDGEAWCLWFRDRFMPVMTTYYKKVREYRNGNPGLVWKSLSVTARYETAKALIDTRVSVGSVNISIWKVRAAPFKDSVSPDKPDRVDRMLAILGQASTQAKIKDPEGEAGKTNVSAWANAISPHKVGGGLTDKAANVQTAAQAKSKRDLALSGQYGTNTTRGSGTGNTYGAMGLYGAAPNQYGFKAITGDSDTSHLDMSDVTKNENDKGVSVPQKLAEQLIIRTMLKAGFTDPRQIAEMLALTNYESGGYKRTTESLNYRDPNRLMRMFREIKTTAQASQLISQGEEAIANAVYGGSKGAELGNRNPGDGWKYRGRGFVQLTGAANYARIGKAIGIDLLNHPELASNDPNVMAEIAVQFFKESQLLQSIANGNDFSKAATGLNGGLALPGMSERYSLYQRYLRQLQSGDLGADGAKPQDAANDSSMGGSPTSAPVLGGGNLPSPSAMPGGGYGTASGNQSSYPGGSMGYPGTQTGGGSSGSGEGVSLVKSGASASGGLRLKSGEAVAGGEAHPGIKALARMVQQRVQNFKEITAMNDAFHRREKPNSKHAQGLAMDFTVTNGVAGSDAATAVVKAILGQAGMASSEYMVINEYRKPSAKSTGGHVHTHFTSAAAADKFAKAAGVGQSNGQDPSALQNRGLPPPPPSAVDIQSANNAANTPIDTSGPSSASDGMPPVGTQINMGAPPSGGNNTPVSSSNAPKRANNSNPSSSSGSDKQALQNSSQDVLNAFENLGNILTQTGAADAAYLEDIAKKLQTLIEQNKANGAPQKMVNMGG